MTTFLQTYADRQGTVTIVRKLRKIPPLFLGKEKELAFVPREVTCNEAYHLV